LKTAVGKLHSGKGCSEITYSAEYLTGPDRGWKKCIRDFASRQKLMIGKIQWEIWIQQKFFREKLVAPIIHLDFLSFLKI